MGPAQLLRQCRNNSLLWERVGKFHHPGEIRHVEAATKLRDQCLRQRGKNLLSVMGALVPKDIAPDAIADSPVKVSQGHIYSDGRLASRFGD